MCRNRTSKTPSKPLTILSLSDSIGETSYPYNELSLPLSEQQDITICTYFKTSMSVPKEITLFEGDDSLIGFFRKLGAALEQKQYDIAHAHSPHVALFYLLASLFRSGNLMHSTVYTVHSSYPRYKLRNKLLLIPVVAFFARVVCCSNSSLESFPRFLRWLAGNRLAVVQNGVNIDRIDRVIDRGPKVLQERPFSVVSVGRLIELKGPMRVLNAYMQTGDRDSNLIFIGDGHLRAELTAEVEKFGLKKQVKITGLIPRDEVYARLAQADLTISASRVEGLPLAVLEAMACRCPVILSDIASHREIAGDVDFIPLIKVDDVDGFARDMRRFQSMSASERSILGAKCRELVEERFSLPSTHSGYEKAYLQLIGENGRYATTGDIQ